MRLEELTLAKLEELAPGAVEPVEGNFCKYCGCRELVLLVKLRATGGSLAGVQPKVSARKVPVLRCEGCKHESEGR